MLVLGTLCSGGVARAAVTTPTTATPAPVVSSTTTSTTTTSTTTATGPRVGVPIALTDYTHDYARWAGTGLPGTRVRSGPSSHTRTVARLHLYTEDGLPEVYQVLAEEPDKWGTMWVHIAVPMRPNGVTGWVPEDDLTQFTLVRALLEVNLRARRITLVQNGKIVFQAPVGVGKPSTPTPTGRFWVREKFPVNPPVPLYGPYAIGTSDYSTTETDWPGGGIIGIHGTSEPNLIPGAPSHGCIRLRNPDITRLYRLVQVGTPIVIIRVAVNAPPLRCFGDNDPLYRDYHDHEWGRPVRDERALYERLSLEAFQSGLSWLTILRKRDGFRAAFADF